MSAARNCSDLGVCQGRTPACAGCTPTPHPFAPGAIEWHRRTIGTPSQRRELLRWMQLALLAMALTGGVALLAGFITGLALGA